MENTNDLDVTDKLTDQRLDNLVASGDIKSYDYVKLYEDARRKDMCTNERLTLEFPSGKKIIMYTICSGSAENTSLWFEDK